MNLNVIAQKPGGERYTFETLVGSPDELRKLYAGTPIIGYQVISREEVRNAAGKLENVEYSTGAFVAFTMPPATAATEPGAGTRQLVNLIQNTAGAPNVDTIVDAKIVERVNAARAIVPNKIPRLTTDPAPQNGKVIAINQDAPGSGTLLMVGGLVLLFLLAKK